MQMLCCCLRSYDNLCAWRESLHDLHKHCFLQKKSPRPAWKRADETLSIGEAPRGCQKALERAPQNRHKKGPVEGVSGGCFLGVKKFVVRAFLGGLSKAQKFVVRVSFPLCFAAKKFVVRAFLGPEIVLQKFVVRPLWSPLWSDLFGDPKMSA